MVVHMDFVDHYSVSLLARNSISSLARQKSSIYDPKLQLVATNRNLAPFVINNPVFVPYPPYFFLFMLPLTFLPINWAWLLWTLITVSAIAWSSYFMASQYFKTLFPRVLIIVLIFAAHPTWCSIRLGNPAAWLSPGLALFWIALRDGLSVRAGFSSLMQLIKIQYLPIAGLAGIIVGGKRYFFTLLFFVATLVGLSALLFGSECIRDYPRALEIGDSLQMAGVNVHLFQNIRGTLFLLFDGTKTDLTNILSRLALVAGTVIVGLAWYARRKINFRSQAALEEEPISFELLASISVLVSLLISLHTYKTDYGLVLLPGLWLWVWSAHSKCKLSNFKKRILQAFLLAFPLFSWLFFFFQDFFMYSLRIQPFAIWAAIVLSLATEGLVRDFASKPRLSE